MKVRKFHSAVNVPIDSKTRQRIEKMANAREVSMADIVREILSNAFEKPLQVTA